MAGAAIGASLLLVAALAAFATGAALASRRTDIELLYLLGTNDRQLARPYAARSLVHGLIGGAVAAAAILATVAALGDSLGGASSLLRPAAPSDGIGLGDWRLWSVLAIMIAAAGIFALIGAQATVRRRLAQLP
jgi:cell division protein FtsX